MRDIKQLVNLHSVLEPLGVNEVYVLLLVKKGKKRQILDTVLIKSNNFDEFFNKVSMLINKSSRMPFQTEILLDINKKDVVKGLKRAFFTLQKMIQGGKDVRNFFTIILKNIRYSQITNYTMVKSNDILYELEPLFVVRERSMYYNILNKQCDDCIKKPEIPIPGVRDVELVYVNNDLFKSIAMSPTKPF